MNGPRRMFRDLLVRRKLTALMTLTSAVTLLLAGFSWLAYDYRSTRADQVQELSIIARTVGQNVSAAIDLEMIDEIDQGLQVLSYHSPVRRAAVFDLDGDVLSEFTAPGAPEGLDSPAFRRQGSVFDGETLSYYAPIYMMGDELGVLFVESDLHMLERRRADILMIVLAMLACSLTIAFLIANRLQRFISQPLVELSETVRAVSKRKDYSIRAIPHARDEIGFLTVSFNEMLEAIQSRDASLERHKEELEVQVEQRTRELRERNDQLRGSMEEARGAAVAKSQFLANMSHEIRTPMNGILGMNDLLLESSLTDQQKSYAEIVKGSAETLLEIINDILDFSKIEAGKLVLEQIEFDPSRAIEDVVGLLSGPARKKGLDLICWLSPDVPRVLRGDPVRFRQIVTNLLGNAVKFTTSGRVSVRVEVIEQLPARAGAAPSVSTAPEAPEAIEAAAGGGVFFEDESEGESAELVPTGTAVQRGEHGAAVLRVTVEDTGIGIPVERRDRLFRSFSQVDASTTRKFGGTGLGLAISQQLVELMDGEIGVESELGSGSTFWFTARLDAVPQSRAQSFILPAGLEPPRVLVMDSSAAVREVLHRQLEAWGIEHDIVSDAQRAFDAVVRALRDERCYDLVLVEEEVDLDRLRECLEPESGAEPSIVLLSWGGTQVQERRMRTVRSVLSKPVRPSQLFDAVAEASPSGTTLLDEPTHEEPIQDATTSPDERQALEVLLAEDNRVNQLVAGKILERGGFRYTLAANGEEVLEAIKDKRFDVILMDCQMPVMDGFQATRRLRAWEAGFADEQGPIHVIALTANAMKGDRERCLQAGMDDYLSKPVRPEELLGKLDEVLVARRENRDAA